MEAITFLSIYSSSFLPFQISTCMYLSMFTLKLQFDIISPNFLREIALNITTISYISFLVPYLAGVCTYANMYIYRS